MSGDTRREATAVGRLISPTTLSDFLTNYWEKRTLCVKGREASVYREVIAEDDIDAFLARNDLRYPSVRLVKSGQSVPISRYSSLLRYGPYAAEGLIDSDRVYGELAAGATIVCQLLQQSIPRTKRFVCALADELGFRVDAHAFITPKNSCGLSTHYDTASAFILQIGGSKLWRLYKPILELPTTDQVFSESAEAEFELVDEVLLEPGDLLYLPRGVPHCPVTTERYSTHLTVVLFPQTWIDLLGASLEVCAVNPKFRIAPPSGMTGAKVAVDELFRAFEAATLSTIGSLGGGDRK